MRCQRQGGCGGEGADKAGESRVEQKSGVSQVKSFINVSGTIRVMNRVIVVGGAGFIGSAVCRNLLSKGLQPVVMDMLAQYMPQLVPDEARVVALRKRFEGIDGQVIFTRGNASNYGEIHKMLAEHKPSAVIHLGGISITSTSNEYIEEAIESSLQATISIIRAIAAVDSSIRFVYTSSSTIYGDFQYAPADEKHPSNPKGVYAGIKLAGENITRAFCTQLGIPFVIVRPQAVYGPTDTNRRVLQKFVEAAMKGEELQVNDPTNAIDFTYLDDVAEGFVLAATKENAVNETFNLSSGNARTLQELVDILKKYFPDLKVNVREANQNLPRRGSMSIKKAKELLSYEPKYTLEKGVEEYVKHLKENKLFS